MGFAEDHLIPLVDEGLGNSAYLLDLGDGRALAVDAGRDPRTLHTAVQHRGLSIAYAADTHLHADFPSGGVQLAHDTGATVLASAAGRRAFTVAGILARTGVTDLAVLVGGAADWAQATGRPLKEGR